MDNLVKETLGPLLGIYLNDYIFNPLIEFCFIFKFYQFLFSTIPYYSLIYGTMIGALFTRALEFLLLSNFSFFIIFVFLVTGTLSSVSKHSMSSVRISETADQYLGIFSELFATSIVFVTAIVAFLTSVYYGNQDAQNSYWYV